jgi:hypothetical protein
MTVFDFETLRDSIYFADASAQQRAAWTTATEFLKAHEGVGFNTKTVNRKDGVTVHRLTVKTDDEATLLPLRMIILEHGLNFDEEADWHTVRERGNK